MGKMSRSFWLKQGSGASAPRVGAMVVSAVAVMLLAAVLALLTGCGSGNDAKSGEGAGSPTGQAEPAQTGVEMTIGTLPTEDFLPFWVAQDKGFLKEQGLENVTLLPFQSAQELSAGLSSGSVTAAMTDIPVAATLSQSGTPLTIGWVTLGATPAEGRFGIMVGPNSNVTSLEQLKGVPVGVGSGTMLEYVMDVLMKNAGFTKDEIKKEELKKLPVRLQMVQEGKVAAGVFPQTLLLLGEKNGCNVIADDTKGGNLSQSILAVHTDFIAKPENKAAFDKLAAAWDQATEWIAQNPDEAREILIKYAGLPEPLKADYPIQSYPKAAKPTDEEVKNVLEWMKDKGYLTKDVVYEADGKLTVK